jgi:uncharacterized protein (DUF2249 family)
MGALIHLDLRHLPPPEPMARALEAVESLPPGAELELLTPMMPVPLLELLALRGFSPRAEALADGTARVRVRHARAGVDACDGPARS